MGTLKASVLNKTKSDEESINKHFIGRQPILDHTGEILAYDLSYDIADEPMITVSRSIVALFNHL